MSMHLLVLLSSGSLESSTQILRRIPTATFWPRTYAAAIGRNHDERNRRIFFVSIPKKNTHRGAGAKAVAEATRAATRMVCLIILSKMESNARLCGDGKREKRRATSQSRPHKKCLIPDS